ncbi:ABC transporter substrate-binding protein [Rhizobium sp. NTR19]|uniref:ABC transporter substrate-binding protein n=1 Tax=Neorhizobium turbinariae TaxID=2937795 RepID=A0ABT0IPZ5_9HYPH|nr:ABC transporter substrate-binding protein [Neorhizobium turbinariae]MCK8779904.1 ABC transporter substrate-binding protein [Neorhizobium turbinariae]
MKLNSKFIGTALGCLMALSAPALAAEGYGDCKLYGERGSEKVETAVPGQFTVVINLPAVGEFNGDTPETVESGREFCMAVNIAHRLGIDKVVLKNASFDSIVAGQNKEFDIALALISVTEPRKKVVDFSTPYASGAFGLATRADAPVDEAGIKTTKLGTQAGTIMVQWAQENLPDAKLSVFDDTGAMFTALAAGNVDVVMTDISVILGQVANSNGKLKVVGQFPSGRDTAGIYQKGSAAKPAIDKVIADLAADGTLKALEEQYLAAERGGLKPEDVPVWKY